MQNDEPFEQRMRSDGVDPAQDGFLLKRHGRAMTIYFVENRTVLPIDAEMPGIAALDILVYGETISLKRRYRADTRQWEEIPAPDRFRVQHLLVQWLRDQGLRHDISVGR